MAFIRGAKQISVRAIVSRVSYDFVKAREVVDRVTRHLNIDRRRELRAHAAHALPGRTFALVRLALKHQHITATSLRQVISDTRTDDAAADDDYVRGFHEVKVKRNREKVKKTLARHPEPGHGYAVRCAERRCLSG